MISVICMAKPRSVQKPLPQARTASSGEVGVRPTARAKRTAVRRRAMTKELGTKRSVQRVRASAARASIGGEDQRCSVSKTAAPSTKPIQIESG